MPRLYMFAGMNRNTRVFRKQLQAIPNSIIVPLPQPNKNESLNHYALRVVESVRFDDNPFLVGISFGGIVALEVAPLVNARCCFLISSIRSPDQLPPAFRFFRLMSFKAERTLQAVSITAAAIPHVLRTPSTTRLANIRGINGAWHRWAISAVLRWKPNPAIASVPILQLHGQRDTLFPARYVRADIVVPDAGHLLPITHSQIVNELLVREMQRLA